MKDGVYMAKIEGLTAYVGDDITLVGRKMMVKYANEDWDFDVDEYVDNYMKMFKGETKADRETARHILTYWKYKFFLAQGEEKKAKRCLKAAYDEGNPDAVAQFAYFFYTATNFAFAKNKKKAIRLFEYALSQENMFAEYLLAEAYIYGKENNEKACLKAIPYYEEAMKKGVVLARYHLANCYLVTNQNLEKAKELFEKCPPKESLDKLLKIDRILFDRKK